MAIFPSIFDRMANVPHPINIRVIMARYALLRPIQAGTKFRNIDLYSVRAQH